MPEVVHWMRAVDHSLEVQRFRRVRCRCSEKGSDCGVLSTAAAHTACAPGRPDSTRKDWRTVVRPPGLRMSSTAMWSLCPASLLRWGGQVGTRSWVSASSRGWVDVQCVRRTNGIGRLGICASDLRRQHEDLVDAVTLPSQHLEDVVLFHQVPPKCSPSCGTCAKYFNTKPASV
jgi:hypothetical protein